MLLHPNPCFNDLGRERRWKDSLSLNLALPKSLQRGFGWGDGARDACNCAVLAAGTAAKQKKEVGKGGRKIAVAAQSGRQIGTHKVRRN